MEKIKQLILKLWYSEAIRYLVIGGLTTVISIVSYWLFLQLGVHYTVANVLSWIIAVLFAYLANKLFVFQTRGVRGMALLLEILLFFGARVFSLLVEEGGLALFIETLHMNELVAKLIMQVVVIVLNYIFSKLVIFKKKPEAAEGETKGE